MPKQQSKERNAEYKREWRKKNPVRSRELSKMNNKRRKLKGLKPKPLTEEQKARKKELWNVWKAKNPERVLENDRRRRAKAREKELRRCFSQLMYERRNPDRKKTYYYNNRDAVLAQKREYKNIRRVSNPSP